MNAEQCARIWQMALLLGAEKVTDEQGAMLAELAGDSACAFCNRADIPKEMDESYDEYLALQKEQGFNLEKYAGKRAKRYTYEIINYPTGEAGVQANLLIYKNTVIAGEVLSPQLDGFLHGLTKP